MSNESTATLPLPEPRFGEHDGLDSLLRGRRSRREFTAEPLTLADVGALCWATQGVNDPASGFRATPSAGATFPLELYLAVGEGGVTDLDAGVYSYLPDEHALEKEQAGSVLDALYDACLEQEWVKEVPIDLVLTAIPERTTKRYPVRGAERYVPMEVGHAGENLYLAAEALGLGTVCVGAFEDDAVARVIDAAANEIPYAVYPVGHPA